MGFEPGRARRLVVAGSKRVAARFIFALGSKDAISGDVSRSEPAGGFSGASHRQADSRPGKAISACGLGGAARQSVHDK